ncbi:protein HEATR9 isoform X4 [Rattus norvegicus]|uniref:HEAT repeat containing 9 isoform 4 n=1 Tax=Rattus norvegicus TaxID=10116 RepID=UPI0003D0E126|nr:protein HEATR9 isoform X3 [Rattus norvegicus]|eukprot:XP_006247083.1 PREDICTED: protein HEATR9 isoform X3 [Rattus norvegicus]
MKNRLISLNSPSQCSTTHGWTIETGTKNSEKPWLLFTCPCPVTSSQLSNLHVSISKLTLKPKVERSLLDATKDPLKWQRLKELTNSLNSPQEDEQCYAAYALGNLGVNKKFVMESLQQAARTGSAKVKAEIYKALAILGCLDKSVVKALIKQLMEQKESQRLETLVVLRVALNAWAAVPKSKRPKFGNEEKLVPLLQTLIDKSLNEEESLEAALCLGFLRPSNSMVQQFLIQCLCQGSMPQRMKALRMLVKMMNVHSAAVTRAILDQLHSNVIDDRLEATQMLKTIGLEKIQAQGLEELTFDLLKKKMHNEPFQVMRQAVSETVDVLKMKPLIMKLMEEQLMSPDVTERQEAIISLGALGFRNEQVFHLLLDMLDADETKTVKKSIQETLLIWASRNPWIRNKLTNKVFFVYDVPKTVKVEPTRFQKEPESLDNLCITDFRRVKLSTLSIAKSCNKLGGKLEAPAFSFYFSKPKKEMPKATGPWEPKIRQQLRNLVLSQNRFV